MIGARAGDVVLVVGANDAGLAAGVALVTGLNGRTVVLDRADGASTRVEEAAAEAGALVEYQDAPPAMLPLDDATFDVVVILTNARPDDRRAVVTEAVRVLKPGGRVLVRTASGRGGLIGAARTAAADEPGSPLDLLARAGAIAARCLADVQGVAYFEARKTRDV